MKHVISILLLLVTLSHSEENPSVEKNILRLTTFTIPDTKFSDDTTVYDVVRYLNLLMRSPDPRPPKSWKIYLEVSPITAKMKVHMNVKNLNLHQVLGMIADKIGAEVIITRQGYILRESNYKPFIKDEPKPSK